MPGPALSGLDAALYRLIHRHLRARRVDPLMVGLTHAGTKSLVWFGLCAAMTVFYDKRARRAAVVTAGSILTTQAACNMLLKPAFRRRRPFLRARLGPSPLVKPPIEPSWPSGHSASSAAAFTVLTRCYPRLAYPLLVLALTISYSRVYVGVHYPFDVAAGAGIGGVVGVLWSRAWRGFIEGERPAGG